jgi:hypothetical protein
VCGRLADAMPRMHSGAISHDETFDHREMWEMTRLTRIRTDRRRVLAGGVALFASTVAIRKAGAQSATARGPEHAIFTEFSPESKLVKAGWNTRVFTHTDALRGNGIQCDFATGIVTLAPGSYHFTGVSIVAYMSGGEPAEMTTVRAPASAGYCRLRIVGPNRVLNPGMRDVDNADPSVICIGSPGTANLTASLFEANLETDKTIEMVLEHQSGSNPEQIYLRVFTQNSPWHAMARISIRNM